MTGKSFLDSNRIWFTIVLLHIAGSILVSLLGLIPFGGIAAATVIWCLIADIPAKNLQCIGICTVGWIVTVFAMYSLNISFQGTMLLNLILLLYVFWICKKAYMNPLEYCYIKKVSVKSIGLIIIAAIFLFIMAGYVNACSMLVFQNLLESSLQGITDKPLQTLIAVAIMPAIIEEVLFRGMIYRGISNKKLAIIISALLFAFLHMNFNQMCYAFIMGLAFALVIYMTDNLTVSILLHMLFNAFTVLICCFPENNIIQAILRCNIAGYSLFNPVLTNTQGNIEMTLVIIGGIIAILSAMIAAYMIFLIRETQEKKKVEKMEIEKNGKTEKVRIAPIEAFQTDTAFSRNKKWKPNAQFFAGSGICLLVAILYEVLL